MKGIYRIAELDIEIISLYEAVHRLCKEYQSTSRDPVFTVKTLPSDIEFERKKSERDDLAEGRPVRNWPESYLETLAVYRKIAEKLPSYRTILMHGSCVAVDGAGYLFTAKSGTGKSTHTRLWREVFGERALMVNDDKPLIRISEDQAVIFGTPWDGKHRLSTNIAVPLRSICILKRGAENTFRPVSFHEVYPMLLQQVYRPLDAEALEKTLPLVEKMASLVRLGELRCNMDPEAARVAYQALK